MGVVLTLGVFDGVHRGHVHLLEVVREEARRRGIRSCAITFENHPEEVIFGREIPYILGLDERVEIIKSLGIDIVRTLPFTEELSNKGASEFVDSLIKEYEMEVLVIGPDFALGRGREGDREFLEKFSRERGFELITVMPFEIGGVRVSSSILRDLIARGDVRRACELLGRPFSLRGVVGPGDGRGRRVGFPTANIEVDPKLIIPMDGVYATIIALGGKEYPSVTNIGVRPTFGGKGRTVEVFIMDFEGDIYGERIGLKFVDRIRDEMRFPSPSELSRQIERDIERAREILR